MSASSLANEYLSSQTPNSNTSEYNKLSHIFNQLMRDVHTTTLCKVVAVTNAGGVSEVGFVDVQPLVNMTDYRGNAIPHTTVFHLPYFRLQGGSNAIIIDPQVGDIGICMIAERDISKVKSTKAQANPGSKRHFSMSDGLYVGGVLNGVPTQYVQFQAGSVTVHSPSVVNIEAPTINLKGSVNATSTIVAVGDITGAGTSLHSHTHSGVKSGTDNSGAPN